MIEVLRHLAMTEAVYGLGEWADALSAVPIPKKADQDQLDAILCALIGLHWQTATREFDHDRRSHSALHDRSSKC